MISKLLDVMVPECTPRDDVQLVTQVGKEGTDRPAGRVSKIETARQSKVLYFGFGKNVVFLSPSGRTQLCSRSRGSF